MLQAAAILTVATFTVATLTTAAARCRPSSEFTDSYQSWQKEWSRPEVIGMFALSATFVVGWVALLLLPCFRHVRPRGKSVPLALGSALGAAAAGAYAQR